MPQTREVFLSLIRFCLSLLKGRMWMLPSYMRRPFIMQPKQKTLTWLSYLWSLGATCTRGITWTKNLSNTPVWDLRLISALSSMRVSVFIQNVHPVTVGIDYLRTQIKFNFCFCSLLRNPPQSAADQQSGCKRGSRYKSTWGCYQAGLAQPHHKFPFLHATSSYWTLINYWKLKDELNCLFPERQLPRCDVIAIQTIKQPMNWL